MMKIIYVIGIVFFIICYGLFILWAYRNATKDMTEEERIEYYKNMFQHMNNPNNLF